MTDRIIEHSCACTSANQIGRFLTVLWRKIALRRSPPLDKLPARTISACLRQHVFKARTGNDRTIARQNIAAARQLPEAASLILSIDSVINQCAISIDQGSAQFARGVVAACPAAQHGPRLIAQNIQITHGHLRGCVLQKRSQRQIIARRDRKIGRYAIAERIQRLARYANGSKTSNPIVAQILCVTAVGFKDQLAQGSGRAIVAGIEAFRPDDRAIGRFDIDRLRIQAERGYAKRSKFMQFARLGNAVFIGIAPDLQRTKLDVICINNTVSIAVPIG